jgi:hypothetical protein
MAKTSMTELVDKAKRNVRKRRSKQLEPADWNDVDSGILADFVSFAQVVNGAVRFGRSRDGATYSIGFYIGDERFTEWVRNDVNRDVAFRDLLDELFEDYVREG